MDLAVPPRDSYSVSTPGNESETLSCEICSKVFAKRPSRNRHRLYCRKKSRLGQPYRRKPCVGCREAKTKCNSAHPRCERCVEKGLDCAYERKPIKLITVPSRTNPSESLSSQTDHVTHAFAQDAMVSNSYGLDIEPQLCEPLPQIEGFVDATAWASCDLDNSLTTALVDKPTLSSRSLALMPPTPCSSEQESDHGIHQNDIGLFFGKDIELGAGLMGFELPLHPTNFTIGVDFFPLECTFFDSPFLKLQYLNSLHASVSQSCDISRRQSPFVQSSRDFRSQVGISFLLQNIRSFPKTLLDTESTPPFIHKSAFTEVDFESNCLSLQCKSAESLAICRSIVQMHTSKNLQMSSFLWRTIISEQKRLDEQHREADEWNVLSMLQAITIYIVLRIFDEDSFTIDFDKALIQTMTSIAMESEESGFLCSSEVLGKLPQWSDWILMESKRRTVTLLFIIHLLFDINPGQRAKAMTGLSQLPLPASKLLWEATTEIEWTKHYNFYLQGKEGRPALTFADLMSMEKDPRSNDINQWYTTLDSFGVLVMMAATSLVS